MTAERWRCKTCGRERQPGDATPPLAAGLSETYRTGRCMGEKGKPYRAFERIYPPAEHMYRPAGPRDLPRGEALKEEGQDRASNGWPQRDGWSERFDAAVTALALTRTPFTSEHVTAQVGLPPSGSPSAVGARMTAAAKRNKIRKTGRMVKAERPNQHAAMLTEWRGA